jgi:carbamate kinase
VHGNGPQVGLLSLQSAAYKKETGSEAIDLDVLDAESEGMIGYLLEQEIDKILGEDGRRRGVATLLSQIIVDPNDPAFHNPTKFIGPIYSEEEAMKLGKPVKQDGEYYRQVVPSPRPLRLIDQQLTAVKLLTNHDCIVICAGGGGIPVFEDEAENRLVGIEAVIDKDRAACMLGKTLGADGLMILTDVPGVALNFGKTNQKFIRSASPERLLELASDGVDGSANFPDGSMGPKVGSAIEFVQRDGSDDNTERWSMIGSLKDASGMLLGEAGSLVTNKHGVDHLEFY